MPDDYTVGDLVAEILEKCGVSTVFGIVSIHNIPMLDAISRRNTIRFVMTRGETGAAHIADGYARVSGGLGVIFSSTGPGAANAVPGIVEARSSSTPLLHLTGATSTKFANREAGAVHDIPDQFGMLRSVSKNAYRVHTAQQTFGILLRAITDALTPPQGPVSVEIPIDLQRVAIKRPAELDFLEIPLPKPPEPSSAILDKVAAQLLSVRRPLLWLGSGAHEAREAVSRFLRMGFGMVTSLAGRGVIDEDHPLNLGAFTGNGIPDIQKFYATCDGMLIVGSRMRAHETGDFSIPLPGNRIQIDIDPIAHGRTYLAETFICGEAHATLAALADRLENKISVESRFSQDIAALKKKVRDDFRSALGPYGDFSTHLRAALPRETVWARDITISNSAWGNRLFPIYEPRDNIYPKGAGIGQGLCLGIGAAIAAGRRKTIVMTGDGGLFFNLSELWTAVEQKAELIIMVMNDRGYGVIRQIQDVVAGGRHFYTDLRGPDLGELAAVARIPFWKVSQVSELSTSIEAALKKSGATLIEVDMVSIGQHPPYYPFNQRPQT